MHAQHLGRGKGLKAFYLLPLTIMSYAGIGEVHITMKTCLNLSIDLYSTSIAVLMKNYLLPSSSPSTTS